MSINPAQQPRFEGFMTMMFYDIESILRERGLRETRLRRLLVAGLFAGVHEGQRKNAQHSPMPGTATR
jgi:hypothetical protein